ncbi:MAG: hypothetical protein KAT70_04460, partial [Thermoplasmata archaeon]|nr:hypothetical protein [Thermoplasmata archaeon]
REEYIEAEAPAAKERVLNQGMKRPFNGEQEVSFERFPSQYQVYYVILVPGNSGVDNVDVDIVTTGSPTFFTIVPILLLGMAGVSVVIIVYMSPLKKKYAAGSIYR